MKDLDFKATLYDILGYIIPGIITIFLSWNLYLNLIGENDLIKSINNSYSKNNNIITMLIISIAGYYIGHLISTLSSIFIEKYIVYNKWIKYFSVRLSIKKILSSKMEEKVVNTFNEKYGSIYEDSKDFRTIICFVEKNYQNIYSTAFVFLSFYGMARNVSFIFLNFSIAELIIAVVLKQRFSFEYSLLFIFVSLVFFYEYLKYLKYFKQHILNGFIAQ